MLQAGKFSGFDVALHEPGVAWFEFNRPDRLNGMRALVKRDLVEALLQAQMDDAVRVVVFTGSGRAFCAGDDLNAYGGSETDEALLVPPIDPGHRDAISTYDALRSISQPINLAIRNLDKLSIAAVNGIAIQSGFSLGMARPTKMATASAVA